MSSIGVSIWKHRNAKAMTQAELAEVTGLSKLDIVEYEQDETEPSISTLATIANRLDVTVPDLLGYTNVYVEQDLSIFHTDELLQELWRRAKDV